MSWWKIGVWLLATFGVAGTIALAVFFPTMARLVGAAVGRCFALVFSYRVGCAVVAALLAYLVADYVRHSIEDKRHADAEASFRLAQSARDRRIAEETRESVWKEIADATAANAVIDKEVKDFTDALPVSNPPTEAGGNLFAVGASADRLRRIAGQSERGRAGSKRVPKAHASHWGHRDRAGNGLPRVVGRGSGRD
jgi:uncharacterized membrane protein YccC